MGPSTTILQQAFSLANVPVDDKLEAAKDCQQQGKRFLDPLIKNRRGGCSQHDAFIVHISGVKHFGIRG
jgi:hypothetical protein